MASLKEQAKQYVSLKIRMTECLQKHFLQTCSHCKEYARCKLYSEYCDAWIRLEQTVNGETT